MKTDIMPMNAGDGTQLYLSNWISLTDSGLTNGQTYYYGFFAHNQFFNYSEGMGIACKPRVSAANVNIMATPNTIPQESLKALEVPVSLNIGWNDNLGDFSQHNRAYFWCTDGSSEQKDEFLVLQGDVTKLTLKNSLIGKSVKITVTYTSDQLVMISPVLLVNNEDNTIAAVISPYKSQTVTLDGKQITTSEIQGYGDNDQLQFIIQNPGKSVIKVNYIQMTPINAPKTVGITVAQYAELM